MTREQAAELALGLYILHWASGGSSLAAVGENDYGDRWFAPTNWVSGPSYAWRLVDQVEKIDVPNFRVN